MSALRVAMLQQHTIWQNADANRALISQSLHDLDSQPDLVILAEMFTTGFTMDAAGHAESMDGESITWLCEMSLRYRTAICGSLIIQESGRYFNRLVWAEDGKIAHHYDKRHLFRMAHEDRHYSMGAARPVIAYKGWRIMPRICYDLRFPVWNRSTDIDLQMYVANWPEVRIDAWEVLLRARAIENQCYVAGVNRVGPDGNGIAHCGRSAILDAKGSYAATATDEQHTSWIAATLDLQTLQEFREKFPVGRDADSFDIHGLSKGV